MRVSLDPTGELCNLIVNHPDVFPLLSEDDNPIDLRPLAQNPRARLLVGVPPLGTYVAARILDGVWEFHAGVLPEGRGAWNVEFSEAAIRYMFVETDAIELITRVPVTHLACLTLVKKFGFMPRWRGRDTVRWKGRETGYQVWSLTAMDWLPFDDLQRRETYGDMMRAGNEAKARNWIIREQILAREGQREPPVSD